AGGSHRGISGRPPTPPLDAYIERLWSWESLAPYPHMSVLPRPTLHLMLNFGDAYEMYESWASGGRRFATCAQSWAVGLRNRAHVTAWPRHPEIPNARFRPRG